MYIKTPDLSNAEDQTQGFMHVAQALNQLSYISSSLIQQPKDVDNSISFHFKAEETEAQR